MRFIRKLMVKTTHLVWSFLFGKGDEKYMILSVISLCTIVAFLLVYLHTREERNRIERKDLLDRLMSRDFVEYKEMVQEPEKYEPVSLNEEQEYWREIEESKV